MNKEEILKLVLVGLLMATGTVIVWKFWPVIVAILALYGLVVLLSHYFGPF